MVMFMRNRKNVFQREKGRFQERSLWCSNLLCYRPGIDSETIISIPGQKQVLVEMTCAAVNTKIKAPKLVGYQKLCDLLVY